MCSGRAGRFKVRPLSRVGLYRHVAGPTDMNMALAQVPRARRPAGQGGAYRASSNHGHDCCRE